jgi:hypothetical protein
LRGSGHCRHGEISRKSKGSFVEEEEREYEEGGRKRRRKRKLKKTQQKEEIKRGHRGKDEKRNGKQKTVSNEA